MVSANQNAEIIVCKLLYWKCSFVEEPEENNFTELVHAVDTLRAVFLDKSGRGRDLCQPPRLSLICRSSTETDESVRFETSFSRFSSVRMCLVRNC